MEEERIGEYGEDEPISFYELERMAMRTIPLGIDILRAEGRKGLKDPKKAFLVALDTFIQQLRDDNVANVSFDERGDIASLIDHVPHVEFVNAKAFVLAYIVTSTTQARPDVDFIDVAKMDDMMAYVEQNDIRKDDLVRYARLIQNARNHRRRHRLRR